MNVDKAAKYLEIANAVARLSKDESTKVGAVILGAANEVRSLGYNGAPRGCSADEDSRGRERPEKYFWFSHAELNAITNAARVGVPLGGCSLVVTHPPCMDCARAIVQAGITQVFCPKPSSEFLERWAEHYERTKALFIETGVGFHELQECVDPGPTREIGPVVVVGGHGRDSFESGAGDEGSQTFYCEGILFPRQVPWTGSYEQYCRATDLADKARQLGCKVIANTTRKRFELYPPTGDCHESYRD